MLILQRTAPLALCIIFLFASPVSLYAQQIDEVYNQKIREYTTDPKFLPSSVLNIPDDPTVPSPRKVFGDIIVHRYHAPTTEIYRYYKQLDDASPFLSMEQIGTTEEGRPVQLVIIGNEDAITPIDHYKKQLGLLADPRKITTQDVERIVGDSKPVFYLNGGLHSPEMGSPEMLMELSYRLITGTSEDIKKYATTSLY